MNESIFVIFVLAVIFVSSCELVQESPQFARKVNIMEEPGGGGGSVGSSGNVISCTDSDGGLNYFVQGSCVDSVHSLPMDDGCIQSNESNNGWLREINCEDRGSGFMCQMNDYECPYGCYQGACLNEAVNQTTEYKYEMEIESLKTFNSTFDADALVFRAVGRAGYNDGFKVSVRIGNGTYYVSTDEVAMIKPNTLGGSVEVFYYNLDGDWRRATGNYFFMTPTDISPYDGIKVDYQGAAGDLEFTPHNTFGNSNVLVDIISLGEDLNGFRSLGRFQGTAEEQEIFACGYGYVGTDIGEIVVSNKFHILNPHENSEVDEVHFSLFFF